MNALKLLTNARFRQTHYYMGPQLLCMSSYYYIRVLMLLFMCPREQDDFIDALNNCSQSTNGYYWLAT
jgi:hypothetical protein